MATGRRPARPAREERAPDGLGPEFPREEERPATILLVDDAETILLLERMILGRGPYRLLTARDGEEAVSTAIRARPDLILLDVVMPKMDGFAVCRRLQEEEATRDIPVIMVTTRSEAQNMEKGYESGCADYVMKPINSLELLAKVTNCLGRKESREAEPAAGGPSHAEEA